MTDCRYMLCLESLVGVDPAGVPRPGTACACWSWTRAWRVSGHTSWASPPTQTCMTSCTRTWPGSAQPNQFPFKELHDPQCEEVKLIQITADQYSIISSHYIMLNLVFISTIKRKLIKFHHHWSLSSNGFSQSQVFLQMSGRAGEIWNW